MAIVWIAIGTSPPTESAAQTDGSTRSILPPAEVALPRPLEAPAAFEALQIGYIESGLDLQDPARSLNALRDELLANEVVLKALQEAGYSGITLQSATSPADLTQLLLNGNLEICFAPAVSYVRLLSHSKAPPQALKDHPYLPIFQLVREGDDITDIGVVRASAIFIGPASPLWQVEEPTPEAIRREIEQGGLAFSSSESLASYFFPRIKLMQELGEFTAGRFMFTGSSEELIKHVVSGLIPTGAAELQVLRDYGRAEIRRPDGVVEFVPLYKTLLITDHVIPADPILLRNDLHPATSDSVLGDVLRQAIQTFFKTSHEAAPRTDLAAADILVFAEARRVLGFLDETGLGGKDSFSDYMRELLRSLPVEGETESAESDLSASLHDSTFNDSTLDHSNTPGSTPPSPSVPITAAIAPILP